jgi:hypothetical protein
MGYHYAIVELYLANSGMNFQAGEPLEGSVSGATAVVVSVDAANMKLTLTDVAGSFTTGEPVTGDTSNETGNAMVARVVENLYHGRFGHVTSHDECTDCHDAHTHKIRTDDCMGCHGEVSLASTDGAFDYGNALLELRSIRQLGSFTDFDGDGTVTEGIKAEIDGLKAILLTAIQEYASSESDWIVWSGSRWYVDQNQDGVYDAGDTTRYENRWTPRLVKAAFNFEYPDKDPGAYAHNAKYVIELLYDSIADLESHSSVTVDTTNVNWAYAADFANLARNDSGHFDLTAEAFRHWDEDVNVSASCVRCHTPDGLSAYLSAPASTLTPEDPSSGMTCEACHTDTHYLAGAPLKSDNPTAYPGTGTITFPGGNTVSVAVGDSSGICAACHQGRESTSRVNSHIAGANPLPPDDDSIQTGTIVNALRFRNVHYFPAAAIQQGSVAAVGYEYGGAPAYAGLDSHGPGTNCVYCHGPNHSFDVQRNVSSCAGCHTGIGTNPKLIHVDTTDYDGDANNTETIADVVDDFASRLYSAIREYANENGSANDIAYSSSAYPYFFVDSNNNGTVDSGETTPYDTWTNRLVKSTYNYQVYRKEPGAWAHNYRYVLQLLYDSISDLNGQTSTNWLTGLTRP